MRGARGASLVVLTLCFAAPVGAQSAPVVTVDDFASAGEVTVGVSIQGPPDVNQRPTCTELGLPCETGRTFPDFGLILSGARFVNDGVAVVGELGVYANQWTSYGSPCPRVGARIPSTCPTPQTNDVRSALAGLQVRTRLLTDRWSRTRLFAQALAGPQWSDIGPPRRAVQAGAGFEEYGQNGVAVRFEYDYRFAPDEQRDLSTFRFFIGVGIPIGSR